MTKRPLALLPQPLDPPRPCEPPLKRVGGEVSDVRVLESIGEPVPVIFNLTINFKLK